MRRSPDPALPVADNLLRQGKLGGGLGPVLLFIVKVRRIAPVMFKQAILQVQAQKLHVPAVELAIERPRAAIDQRLQIGIVV